MSEINNTRLEKINKNLEFLIYLNTAFFIKQPKFEPVEIGNPVWITHTSFTMELKLNMVNHIHKILRKVIP